MYFVTGGLRFTAWLKEERDDFCLLIEEMWAGKIVSDSTKDIHAIQKAAQNVLLVDALLQRYAHSSSLTLTLNNFLFMIVFDLNCYNYNTGTIQKTKNFN